MSHRERRLTTNLVLVGVLFIGVGVVVVITARGSGMILGALGLLLIGICCLGGAFLNKSSYKGKEEKRESERKTKSWDYSREKRDKKRKKQREKRKKKREQEKEKEKIINENFDRIQG